MNILRRVILRKHLAKFCLKFDDEVSILILLTIICQRTSKSINAQSAKNVKFTKHFIIKYVFISY